MKFKFNVNMSDKDYLEYNLFLISRSPYGKKFMLTFRIIIAIYFIISIFTSLFENKFTLKSFIGIMPKILLLIVFQSCLTYFISWYLKCQIKSSKKIGKAGYSPSSVIEFYEDSFVEITEENKIEQKYSGVERISIVDNKVIHIHVSTAMTFAIPISCFESLEEYENFLEFIKTKCSNISVY